MYSDLLLDSRIFEKQNSIILNSPKMETKIFILHATHFEDKNKLVRIFPEFPANSGKANLIKSGVHCGRG